MKKLKEISKEIFKWGKNQPQPYGNPSGSDRPGATDEAGSSSLANPFSPDLPRLDEASDSPQLGKRSLWDDAADSLDPADRKKLDSLIKSKREGQAAQLNDSPSADVSLVLSRAKKLEDQGKETTWRPFLDRITKVARAVKSLGDTVVQFDQSGYAALGWSVVSFGLQVAENAEKAREFVLSSSAVITGFIARYTEYENEFRGNHSGEEFDRRMANLYKAILLYIIALNDYLQQCAAERLGRAVSQLDGRSISQRKRAIDDADIEVRDWLLIIILKSSKEHFSILRRKMDQTLAGPSQQCLRSLAFPEIEDRFLDIERAAEGTCKWLIRHERYKDWAARDQSLLWIKGKPGSGKSTLLQYALSDSIIASSIGDRALVLSFFFHNRGTELQRTPLGFFRSLLHQLLRQAPEALLDLVPYFEERCNNMGDPGKDWQWHLSPLHDFVKSSIPKVLENRPVWLFVDALDECGEQNATHLIKEFKSMLQDFPSAGSQFHICFTSRQYPILLLDHEFEICLDHENGEDISTYVQAQFSTYTGSVIPATIPETIIKNASGIFMWARLVISRAFDLHREGATWKKIEAEINKTPPGLNELYCGLVKGIQKEEIWPASLKLFQWICFATRPLSLDELRWAMLLDADCPYQSLQECKSTQDYVSDNGTMKRQIQTYSRGLVEVVASSQDEASSAHVVQFIHQSVKDFFATDSLSALGNNFTTTDAGIGPAHFRLSRICIRYLAMKEIGQSTSFAKGEMTSKFPFLHYATTSWVEHVQHSDARDFHSQEDLLDLLNWPSNALIERWVCVYTTIDRFSSSCPPNQSTLVHITARHNVLGLLTTILQKANEITTSIDIKDEDGRTPLLWAAKNGHEAVVKLLLDTGQAEINSKDIYGQMPLLWAAENGHEAVVKLLLDTGQAEINLKDTNGQTPLSWAAEKGHEAVVKLLLDTGQAEINSKDTTYGQTPLSWAAENGHEAVVKLLLDTGQAEINSKATNGQTPLSWAAKNGHEAVVELLLDTGQAEINSKAIYGQTPLSWAAKNGHEAVVKLLLDTGQAEINSKATNGQTPLSWAAKNGHEAVVKLLLDTGQAEIDSKDTNGQTPLSWAAENGHEAVVKLLLEAGAEDK